MTWVKIDDGMPDHPKVLAAGPEAAWLYVAGICYCGRLTTDGFIPEAQVARLTTLDAKKIKVLVKALIEAGLWKKATNGYQVHDYLEHQQARESVELIREKTRQRVAKFRERKHLSNAEVTPLLGNACNADVTEPDTDTDTDTENTYARRSKTQVATPVDNAAAIAAEALIESLRVVCGWTEPLTSNELGRIRKAAKQLLEVGATEEQIYARADQHELAWPNRKITPTSLASNWQTLSPPLKKRGRCSECGQVHVGNVSHAPCDECSGTGWTPQGDDVVHCASCQGFRYVAVA